MKTTRLEISRNPPSPHHRPGPRTQWLRRFTDSILHSNHTEIGNCMNVGVNWGATQERFKFHGLIEVRIVFYLSYKTLTEFPRGIQQDAQFYLQTLAHIGLYPLLESIQLDIWLDSCSFQGAMYLDLFKVHPANENEDRKRETESPLAQNQSTTTKIMWLDSYSLLWTLDTFHRNKRSRGRSRSHPRWFRDIVVQAEQILRAFVFLPLLPEVHNPWPVITCRRVEEHKDVVDLRQDQAFACVDAIHFNSPLEWSAWIRTRQSVWLYELDEEDNWDFEVSVRW